MRPYLPAFMAKSGKIACLECGNGPGTYAGQTGLVPFHEAGWEVNHGPTTIKPPTIEDIHKNQFSNIAEYPPLVRPNSTRLPMIIFQGVVDNDDVFSHTHLGTEEQLSGKVAENTHRSRLNTSDEEDSIMEHGPAQD